MSYVAKLTLDPTGTPVTRTLSYPVLRDWPEREVQAYRQDFLSPSTYGTYAGVSSVARPGTSRPTGILRLQLTLADRQWIRTHSDDLFEDALTLRVYPDSTDASTYSDLVIANDEVEETYERVFQGRSDSLWILDLPVLVLQEVTP